MLFSLTSLGRVRSLRAVIAVWLAAFMSSSSLVVAQSSDDAIAADAGMVVTKLWEDLNRDGIQDVTEPGVAGVLVSLFRCDGAFVESRLSNDLGVTPFVAPAGCYQLRYSSVEGYRYCPSGLSGDVANDSDVNPSTRTSTPFDIVAGTYQINVDAGIMKVQNSEIGDRVWHDLNANGVQDFSEPGLASVPIALLDCAGDAVVDLDGLPRVEQSDSHGNFLFEHLTSGCYRLEAQLDEGQFLTAAAATASEFDSDVDPVSLRTDAIELYSSHGEHSIDMGVFRQGRIGDYVWLDSNRNGVQEAGEQGMDGVSVMLLDEHGVPTGRTAVTDNTGHYEFDSLRPGSYRLQFVIPQDYVAAQKDQGVSDSLDNDGNSLGVTATFEVLSDQTQSDIDFGVVQQQVVEIALEARTLGEDADSPIGPYIRVGDPVSWEYIVTNTGDLPLFYVDVQDDQGVDVVCPESVLEAGDSVTCTALASDAQAGQYTNLATVNATHNPEVDSLVTASDRSHYFGTDPAIMLSILVNGVDANQPSDLTVAAGDPVVWQYRVTNTGNVPLENVGVTDSNADVSVTCPATALESGVEMTCTASAVAVAGEYVNTGTASGEVPEEEPIVVTATDTSFYFGTPSALTLVLLTNGIEATAPPGPMIGVGETVTWTYRLTNGGPVVIGDIQVVDSEGAAVSCPVSAIAPGQTINCTATGTAVDGQFTNSAFWSGTADGEPTQPSNTAQGFYFGTTPMPGVDFNVRTNGADADTQDFAPQINAGEVVTWTYTIENSGNVALTNVVVTDDQIGTITCPATSIEPGESLLCSATGLAEPGPYTNLGMFTAQTPGGTPVMASDPSNYFGVFAELDVQTLTNDLDSDVPPGASIAVGEPVEWRYVVTNIGNVDLFGLFVTDSVLGAIDCPTLDLPAGETVECVASGLATAGQYANIGTACAPQNEKILCADDPSHYFGGTSSVSIETRTNGADADTQDFAPQIDVGNTVTWTYSVTNTGSLTLTDVAITDDQLGPITCPSTQIEPGATLVCTAFGTAQAGLYTNVGSVIASDPQGNTLQDTDPSNYFGVDFGLDIETLTNGVDADTPPGPIIAVGEAVEWLYVVTNTGNVGLFGFVVTDSELGSISCPTSDLAPGQSVTCTASGTATEGQYMNLGTVCAPQNEELICAEDPSHYLGGASAITIETLTNGADADTPDLAPEILVGSNVTWTYNVTNTGNTLLTNVSVTDDILGPITCPTTQIAAGQTIVCTATGTVQPGLYANVGSVVGTDPQGVVLNDSDPTHHFGAQPAISIETLTNTIDADSPPGPTIAVGGDVQWTYVVTNTGNVDLFGFVVTDDILGPITCPTTDIAVGQSIECFATGIATAGQYANLGSVCAPYVEEFICDEDPSHYFGGEGALEIQKLTNGVDADSAPGVSLTVGEAITWSYVVTNTGDLTITQVNVTDDQGVVVSCPVTTLEPGASTTCTGTGVATPGQYVNVGTACAQALNGDVCDSDSSFYLGLLPALQLEKLTNGLDADSAPGPVVAVGESVSWRYVVTNTSAVAVGAINVTDDQGVVVTCPMDTLLAGETMTCSGSGIATPGQYMNLGTVSGVGLDASGNPVGDTVSVSDPSHYFGGSSSLSIEKFTNGVDVSVAPGPSIAVGQAVEWTYVVTNTGNVSVTTVSVSDDQGVSVTCPMETLAVGESMTCTGSGVATVGQYMNIGSVSGQGVDGDGNPVGAPQSDTDPSFYFGVDGGLSIEKFTNDFDVAAAPGPSIAVGDVVEWTYRITNTGNVTVTSVIVTDDQGVSVTCPMDTLAAGESMTCTGNGVATAGQYMNIGSVSGQGVDGDGNPVGTPLSDTDPSFYIGVVSSIDIEKFTNGIDVSVAPGPAIPAGEPVEWTYIVTNTGTVTLTNVQVTDDQGVTVTCPMDMLTAGESMTCTGSGIATAGQYMNIGSASGQGVDGDGNPVGTPQSDADPSFYLGVTASLDIEKFTNGVDAIGAPGPFLPVGSPVEWTYVVTNTGTVTLANVVVSDDQGVVVTCPMDTLAVGESMTCTGSGFATPGQYMNVGSVSGQGIDGDGNPIGVPQTATDASFYFGGVSKLSLEKFTNGEDADDPTGPEITVGNAVEWTYVVLNDGNVTIANVVVTDDQGVAVTCPMDTLAPGESMTCVGSGIATLGQYANIGTVNAQGLDSDGNPFGLDLSASDPSHYLGVALPTASIGDFVFLDINRDGDQDFNEPGIPGVTVNLWVDDDGDGLPDTQIASTTTGPDGDYLFTDLDPNLVYIVQFVTAPGQQLTVPLQGGDSANDSNPNADTGITGPISLNPGQTDLTIDAGIFSLMSSVSMEKTTNGEDADTVPGPEISVGSLVLWEYTVTNTGETLLTDINVSDDQGVDVICPATELAPGESFVCSGEGLAIAGQYKNIGNVTAQPVDDGQPVGGTISGVDPSHYLGIEACLPGFVLDQFSHVSFSNNDGDMEWAGPWQEHDPQGGGADSGNVMVANGALVLNDYPNSHTEPSASRSINLEGYVAAMLMFDWSTSQEVGPEDTAVVEISSDGGQSFTVLNTFSDMHGANSGSEAFDISSFISSQTVVRFRIAEKFGAMWDKFMVDNVRIDKKCENTQVCIASSSAGHSFWMAGFNNPSDTDRFDFESGAQFEQFDDGTATLTGTIVDNARPDRRFEVHMSFAGRTLEPPVGSPKNGFGADPTGWEYYPEWTGSWSGLDDYAGVEISLARRGPAFQVGLGANDRPNEQDIYGASAWYDWTVDSQADACSHTPGLCIEHTGIGDLNVRLDCEPGGPQACTSSVNETHKHAFYFQNFNGDGVTDRYDLEEGAEFERNQDGTARFTGVIFKQGQPNYRFAIDVNLSGGTDLPPPGSPYNPHNANPDDWFYYPNWNGELEGLTWNLGAQLSIDRRGASFQIGTGANAHAGENDIYGGSGWFDWSAHAQPHDCSYYGDCIKEEGLGDINVQIEQCPL